MAMLTSLTAPAWLALLPLGGILGWFNRKRYAQARAAGAQLAVGLGAVEGAARKGGMCPWYQGEDGGRRYAFTYATVRLGREPMAPDATNADVLRLVLAVQAPVPAGFDLVHGVGNQKYTGGTSPGFDEVFHIQHEVGWLRHDAREALLACVREHGCGLELIDRDKSYKSTRPKDGYLDQASALLIAQLRGDEHSAEQARGLLAALQVVTETLRVSG